MTRQVNTEKAIEARLSFLRDRQLGIGSSDPGRIFRGDALQVYHEKTRPLRRSDAEIDIGRWAIDLQRGVTFEPIIIRTLKAREGWRGKTCGQVTHPDHTWARAHPDWIVFSDNSREEPFDGTGVAEIKAPRQRIFDELATFGPRDEYAWQVYWQALVCGFRWGAQAHGNWESANGPLAIIKLECRPSTHRDLLASMGRFWLDHVVPRIPPEPNEWMLIGRQVDAEPIRERPGKVLVVEDPEMRELAIRANDALEMKGRAKELWKAAQEDVKQWIEEESAVDRVHVPGVGRYTIVTRTNSGHVRRNLVDGHRPVDRDALQRILMRCRTADDEKVTVAVDVLEKTLDDGLLDLDIQQLCGPASVSRFLRIYPRREDAASQPTTKREVDK